MPPFESSWFDTADGTRLRLARWPAGDSGGRGTVLLLGGRAEFIEKHAETAGDLIARGFRVWTMDWRGQGLSSRPLANRCKHHIDDFVRYLADLDAVVERRVAPAAGDRPLLLFAHSMGGHIALRYLAERPGRVAALVATAPMVMIGGRGLPLPLVRALARLAVRHRHDLAYLPGMSDHLPFSRHFIQRMLTSDPERGQIHARHFEDNPELCLGGVTWGWLDASLRSSALLLRPDYARRIAVPVFLAIAGRERLVSNRASHRLAGLLPLSTVTLYADSRHEILMERDEIRRIFWKDVEGFLKRWSL